MFPGFGYGGLPGFGTLFLACIRNQQLCSQGQDLKFALEKSTYIHITQATRKDTWWTFLLERELLNIGKKNFLKLFLTSNKVHSTPRLGLVSF